MKIPTDKQLLKESRRVSARKLESDCVLSSSVTTLKNPRKVPRTWKQALEFQEKGLEPEWSRIWGDFLDLVPSISNFLKTMCLGIRVLECSEERPSLIYLYAYEIGGETKFVFSLGNSPVRLTQLTRTGRRKFDLLPDKLQAFYRNVHDGFGDFTILFNGILQVESLHFLNDLLNEPGLFTKKDEKRRNHRVTPCV